MRDRSVILSLFPETPGAGHHRAIEPNRLRMQPPRVRYRPLPCSAILNENRNDPLPFRFSINPYRGCSFGCPFCFARYTHANLDHPDPESFQSRIYVKFQAAQVLLETARTTSLQGRRIAIGSVTDPYQPAEERFQITCRLLSVLASIPGLEISITTRSPLILRDIDLLLEITRRSQLSVQISIITLNPTLARIVERGAPAPRRRLEAIRALTTAGIETGLFVMPILPGITDSVPDLRALLHTGRKLGAGYAVADLLRLSESSWRVVRPVLLVHFPHLLPRYRALVASRGMLSRNLRRTLAESFRLLQAEAGLRDSPSGRNNRQGESHAWSGSLFEDG